MKTYADAIAAWPVDYRLGKARAVNIPVKAARAVSLDSYTRAVATMLDDASTGTPAVRGAYLKDAAYAIGFEDGLIQRAKDGGWIPNP